MKTNEEIHALYHERVMLRGPVLAQMREIRDTYNGDYAVPLPELDRNEKAAVANILNMGLDQTAMRIASTIPDVYCPPVRAGFKEHEQRASDRRRALLGWWEMNNMRLKLRKRARYQIGYACSPVLITPDMERGIPKWVLRDPLTTLPDPSGDVDSVTPDNCIFSFTRTRGWLKSRYPALYATLPKTQGADETDGMVTILEYVDAEERVLIAVVTSTVTNQQYMYQQNPPTATTTDFLRLERVENRAGICPVTVPGRITLDRILGQFDQILGMYKMQAKLMALSVIATQKGVFPETWLVSHPQTQGPPQITTQADPLEGITGIVSGGTIVNIPVNPSPLASQEIDRLERNQRVMAAIPPEFGGESGSNIRTGRRGDAVLSAAVDFPVQENQEVLAHALEEENHRAIAIAKAYFGNSKKSFYVTWKGAMGQVDYVPNDIFDTDRQTVTYSYAGADANNFVVASGQRIGMGTLSKRTFMETDPLVPDAEREHERVIQEQLESAQMQAILQQAQAGAMPITAVARLAELVLQQETPLFAAIQQVHQELQQNQSPQESPAPPGAPETQPGLNQPGAGGEAGTIPPPPGPLSNLADLLQRLHRTNQTPQNQPGPAPTGALVGQGAA